MKKIENRQESAIVLRLDTLMGLAGPEFVHELIEVFLEIARKDFETMRSALQSASVDRFIAAAFSLKATSLNIGAIQLSEFCQEAESPKNFESKTKSKEVIGNIEAHLVHAENYLRGYIEETHSSAS